MNKDFYLAHHGVKGMKWGHRRAIMREQRAQKKQAISNYENQSNKSARQVVNQLNYGKKAAARIEYRINEQGMSNMKAKNIENGRRAGMVALGVLGAVSTVYLISSIPPKPIS